MSFIDLHCHTIASKAAKGESDKRNVSCKTFFLDKLKKSHVSTVAITNHNYFDCDQYEDFRNNDDILVLPGIELDIELTNGQDGHLILVSNDTDEKYSCFLQFIRNIGADCIENACALKIGIHKLPELIKALDCLIIAHYGSKASSFRDEDINVLKNNCSQNVFVEPSSLISAFIYLNKGLQSIIGSDVKDWNNYPGKELPELKIDIDSYSSLKLLLKKDKTVIEQKTNPKIFDKAFPIINEEYNIHETIQLFRDCNVIMGGKSSGKSLFLKAIYSQLQSRGYQSKTKYYAAENVQTEYEKISSYTPTDDEMNKFSDSNDLLQAEIKELKNVAFPVFPNCFTEIKEFIETSSRTRLAKQLGFVSCCSSFVDNKADYEAKRKTLNEDYVKITTFVAERRYSKYLQKDDSLTITTYLEKAENQILLEFTKLFVVHQSIVLANKCIKDFKCLFTQLKATSALPNTTGLIQLFEVEKTFIQKCSHLLNVISREPVIKRKTIGKLDGKGSVTFVKELCCASLYSKFNKPIKLFKNGFATKTKELCRILASLNTEGFYPKLSERIVEISSFLKDNQINSIKDLLGYQSYFIRENGTKFQPSKGEQAVLVLSDCIDDKDPEIDYYLLDEPEMSVGHYYVNSIIVPRIKELCRLNKCVIVCTHDANIGVGTLPFQVVFREEDNNGEYHTYVGNPFSDILKDKNGAMISWKETAVNVLEGGRDALDLREVTYGDRD